MDKVVLSVVVPTYKRPLFLSRAVDSALQAAPDNNVEVIVVPNGNDASWKEVAKDYKHEDRVIWSPIVTAHANAARNHGMNLAKGRYIRFLDDDDYFYPEAAREQLIELIESGADLSFAPLEHVDDKGYFIKKTEPENKIDYISAVVGTGNPTATLTIVYKRDILREINWDVTVNKRQDVYWAYSICAKTDFKSIYYEKAPGAWVQHQGERVSEGHKPNVVTKAESQQLLKLADALKQQDRLTPKRATAISIALWQCVHNGTMYSPWYWFKISRLAEKLMPGQFPRTKIYRIKVFCKINPFWTELAMVPIRWGRVLCGHKYRV